MATNCAAEDGEGADAAFCGLTKIAPARVSVVVEVKDLQRGDVTRWL